MTATRMGWAAGVVAPWCLAIGLLVSITADAGQAVAVGGSLAAQTSRAVPEPDDLVPAATLAAHRAAEFGNFGFDARAGLVEARYAPGTADDFRVTAQDIEPRSGVKGATGGAAPSIDRSNKGDPAIELRPSFDSQLRRRGGPRAAQLFGPHDETMPAGSFSLSDEGSPLDGATSFAPYAAGEDMQGEEARGSEVRRNESTRNGDRGADGGTEAAPTAAIAMRPAALRQRLAQGATPAVSRADALSSTTPAPADGAPVAAVFGTGQGGLAPAVPAATASLPGSRGHRDYSTLLAGENGARERRCLAEAVYFEARSEPEEGQAAVAQVVLNRATSGLYPPSVCGVVYQNRNRYKACQFSFACEGKSLRVTEMDSWRSAQRIADAVASGSTYLSDVGGATHYHANYVRPYWARRLVKMDVIGHHIFYKLRGQS